MARRPGWEGVWTVTTKPIDSSSGKTSTVDTSFSFGARRFGYLVAIAVNAAMLFVVNNLLEWGWFSWITNQWEDVLPLISLSLVAAMAVNVVYLMFDRDWFKALTQVMLAAINLVVTVRIWQVFPFDFSAYAFDWTAVTRAILVVAVIGVGIGLVVETAKFVRAVFGASYLDADGATGSRP